MSAGSSVDSINREMPVMRNACLSLAALLILALPASAAPLYAVQGDVLYEISVTDGVNAVF